jgi:hypothetical protein
MLPSPSPFFHFNLILMARAQASPSSACHHRADCQLSIFCLHWHCLMCAWRAGPRGVAVKMRCDGGRQASPIVAKLALVAQRNQSMYCWEVMLLRKQNFRNWALLCRRRNSIQLVQALLSVRLPQPRFLPLFRVFVGAGNLGIYTVLCAFATHPSMHSLVQRFE